MAHTALYNPFRDFLFDNQACFLTGEKLRSEEEQIQVFPLWLMRAYELEEKPFKLLDESICTYMQLKLPCSTGTAARLAEIERQVEAAFMKGFTAVDQLDRLMLFQWVGKLVYGIIFNEIRVGIRQQALSGEAMNFSQVLTQKFRNLHMMLQSMVMPIQFDGAMPFSVVVTEVDNLEQAFSYRDEINTLVFSLRMKDFGLIVCLQDNGTNNNYHKAYLEKVAGHRLHPIQFEELCARYFYSAYLFNRLPEYTVLSANERVYIEPMPLMDMSMKPIFDQWQVKVFGQVLENFWKPWGFTLFEIIKDPEHPMSFLLDQEGRFITGEEIGFPRG